MEDMPLLNSVSPGYMTEERRMIQETAREFAMNEVLPVANELDPVQGDIPMALRKKLADMGYFGMLVSEDLGGLGLGAFEALMRTVGRPDLIADKRFLTPPDRNRNKTELRNLIEEACAQVASTEILETLHAVGAPAAVINSIDRTFAEPQVVHRDMLMERRPQEF